MFRQTTSILTCILPLFAPLYAQAVTLNPETIEAWNTYVRASKSELAQFGCPSDRLWIDSHPHDMERVTSGSIVVTRPLRGGLVQIPSGLIHHWIGTVFLPDVRMSQILPVLQDYDAYEKIYRPAVVYSKLINRSSDTFLYELKFASTGVAVKAGLLGDFTARYVQSGTDSGYSATEATRLIELENVGTPQERPLSLAASGGYVERSFTILRYRQAAGGVLVEVETLSLSRDVPSSIRWLISPFIQRFARQLMFDTLARLRNAVVPTQSAALVPQTSK